MPEYTPPTSAHRRAGTYESVFVRSEISRPRKIVLTGSTPGGNFLPLAFCRRQMNNCVAVTVEELNHFFFFFIHCDTADQFMHTKRATAQRSVTLSFHIDTSSMDAGTRTLRRCLSMASRCASRLSR